MFFRGRGTPMRVFAYVLAVGWGGLLGTVALCFAFPRLMSHHLAPIAAFFVLIPTSLLIGSAAYGVICVYRTGMKRSLL